MLKQAQMLQYHCHNLYQQNYHNLFLNLYHLAKSGQPPLFSHILKAQVVQLHIQNQQVQQQQLHQKQLLKKMKKRSWIKTFQKQNCLLILLKTIKQNWQTQLLKLKSKQLSQQFKKKSLNQQHCLLHQQQMLLMQNNVNVLVTPLRGWWLRLQMQVLLVIQ